MRNKLLILMLILVWLTGSFSLFSFSKVNAEEKTAAAEIPAATSGVPHTQMITMKDLGDTEGYTLKTVKTERRYDFTRPKHWQVLPSSSVTVTFQHSPALLVERSSLNIMVNNRILKTIPLGKDNVTANTVTIPIPPELLKDRNTLAFQVDQHYTYQCEDPFSAELWTTLLPGTKIQLNYTPKPLRPDLAQFPYPFFDELGYGATRIGYLVPPDKASDKSLEGVATLAAGLGQQIEWRKLQPFLATDSDLAKEENLVIVGTPDENPVIRMLDAKLPLPIAKFPAKGGVLQIIQNPNHPSRGILIVSGKTPEDVLSAARLMVQNPPTRLLVGTSTVVYEQNAGAEHPPRAWRGFVQDPGTTVFSKLGHETLTSRGITSLPIHYPIRLMPDVNTYGQKTVKLNTTYSYSSQLDATQSKLEVLWNGKALKSVKLDRPEGQTLATMTVDIPAEEVFTYNKLDYQFHLFPEKYDTCRYVTDVHIWGTVHNTSDIDVPGTVKAALPDVGFLNDGGFPFTVVQDMSKLAVVLPDDTRALDVQTMLQVMSRLGRLSKSQGGLNVGVVRAAGFKDDYKNNRNVIAIGFHDRNSVFKEIQSKLNLLVEGDRRKLEGPLANLSYMPDQGIAEEVLSPWNADRVVLLLSGQTDVAMKRLGTLFENDDWFNQIGQGNLLVVNGDGVKSLTALKEGEARFITGGTHGPTLPVWAWGLIAFLVLMGLMSLFRLFRNR